MMRPVTIITDGSCPSNPGVGGWAAILRCERTGRELELAGSEVVSSNNRMELMAAIGCRLAK